MIQYILCEKKTKREMPMPKKQKAKIKQKNKCPEKLIRTEAAKEIAEIDRSQQSEDGREYLYKTDPERPGAGF